MNQKDACCIEGVIDIQFLVKCSDGKKRIIQIKDLKPPIEENTLTIETDYEEIPLQTKIQPKQFLYKQPLLYTISFDLTCRGYELAVVDIEEDTNEQ